MQTILVVHDPRQWPLEAPGISVVRARTYLTDPALSEPGAARVFNLCGSYGYQSLGYYVSLLAEARGHRPMPSIATLQDLRSVSLSRILVGDLDELVQSSLRHLKSEQFPLSVYFGWNVTKRYNRLAKQLFSLFQAPMLRARFVRQDGRWQLMRIRALPMNEVPEHHIPFLLEAARAYLGRPPRLRKRVVPRYRVAVLVNPKEMEPPSDPRAIRRFLKAARSLGMGVELLEPEDYGEVAAFDGLFLRETTQVDHHTYRFARRAEAEGLVVIDDPESILRCTNKVYLAELLARHRIPTPRTRVVHKGNIDVIERELGFPCILKQPDSSFSQGVFKVEDPDTLRVRVETLLDDSDLLIAQEFMPTEFDWRVGVLEGRPLYVCRYHMARRHWQIINWKGDGARSYGRVDTLAVDAAPRAVVRTAVRAARLVGDGLYGVDLKQVGRKVYVIEVNDNPSLEAGCEDKVLGQDLYKEIMGVFLRRIQAFHERKASS